MDPLPRPLLIGAILFFLCAGVLVFWGIQTDANFGVPLQVDPAKPLHTVQILGFTMHVGFLVSGCVVGLILYFFPAINALSRKHRETKAILVLNIFLGWTFLGWIAALVWSFTSQTKPANP